MKDGLFSLWGVHWLQETVGNFVKVNFAQYGTLEYLASWIRKRVSTEKSFFFREPQTMNLRVSMVLVWKLTCSKILCLVQFTFLGELWFLGSHEAMLWRWKIKRKNKMYSRKHVHIMACWFSLHRSQNPKKIVSCCCRNFSAGVDFRRHHRIGHYFHNSFRLYLSVWTEGAAWSGCLTWLGCLQRGWGAREQKVTPPVTQCARGLAHTLWDTHTDTLFSLTGGRKASRVNT